MAKGAGMVKKILGGVAKAPGAVAGFTGATIAGAAGGAVKATGQGVVAGVKAAGKMKTKILGEAAEAAAKGGDDVVEAATRKVQYGRTKGKNGYEYFREIDGKRTSIDSGTYGRHRGEYIASQRAKNPNYDPSTNYSWNFGIEEEIAKEAAESGAGFWSGLGDMIQEHPYIAAGIASGAGVAVGGLLFDDDDDE